MQIIEKCPLCDHSSFENFLICEDSLSSHEHFELKRCQNCSFVFTSPRPDENSLPQYYCSHQYISHTAKSAGPIDNIYLLARKFTLRWKINLLSSCKSGPLSLLDYGCGTGSFLLSCQQQNWQVAGFEPALQPRQIAADITGINIADNLQQFDGIKFDIITLWHVLEHVTQLRETISNLTELLKDDGILIIAVPNHESPDAIFYKQHWAAYDVPRHLWHFTKRTMKILLGENRLNIVKIKPMKLDAYYVSLLSEKYLASNKISLLTLVRGALRGLISNLKARSTTNYSSLIYIVTK